MRIMYPCLNCNLFPWVRGFFVGMSASTYQVKQHAFLHRAAWCLLRSLMTMSLSPGQCINASVPLTLNCLQQLTLHGHSEELVEQTINWSFPLLHSFTLDFVVLKCS